MQNSSYRYHRIDLFETFFAGKVEGKGVDVKSVTTKRK